MDPWVELRDHTRARIGLGRAGDGLPTAELLAFQLGHARARDAVHGTADFGGLAAQLTTYPSVEIESRAKSRAEYLLRPDLGRRVDSNCPDDALIPGDFDLAIVVADGLSATAVNDHAYPMLAELFQRFSGWKLAPIVLARQARVAIGDEIGERLGARMIAVLIGERPGLSVPNSLGIYLTFGPKVGRKDSERNCISNIHTDGLSYEQAARKLHWLATEARRRSLTGVNLKEASDLLPTHQILP